MMFRFLTVLALFLGLTATSHAKMTDVSGDDSARMSETLNNLYGAERQGVGLRDPETVLEIWVTRKSGDWLIVQNYSNGTSCIVAMGEHWEGRAPGPA